MQRRLFLQATAALAAAPKSHSAQVKQHNNKPTLFLNGQPTIASFYALTDCIGGRFSFDEQPQQSIRQFAAVGFKLYQLDLFMADCLTQPGPLNLDLARRQIRGVLNACPDAAIVLRWHLNAPQWWKDQNPSELTHYDNGDFEIPDRKLPVRTMQDDLRRTPRASIASTLWFEMAQSKTIELLKGLAKTPEGNALIGIHVANGVYGEWHYWGFMRNEPDTAKPMQAHFANWRKSKGKAAIPVPNTAERKALDNGIFRDPARREHVIDYYRCQQELVANRIIDLCATVKKHWPRPIITGTFYGYFFSVFDRHATGGHLELHKILASPHVDYLSAPQSYGPAYRDPGSCGITRALIETIRLNGKLFLDEMDQTPSWKWRNDVDSAFELTNLNEDIALIRRNILEGYTRGAGHWYYDFGPANNSGWWADKRLMAEIDQLHKVLNKYHQRKYDPAGDVLAVFDTEVFYYTGSIQGTDPLTDPLAVNRTITSLYKSSVAIETIHLNDLDKIDLTRFKVILFANTWHMTAAQRTFIKTRVISKDRHVIFQGLPGYIDGNKLSINYSKEVTGLNLEPTTEAKFQPALKATSTQSNVLFFTTPPTDWHSILKQTAAHAYTDHDDIVHAGGGLLLIHTKTGGPREIRLRNGKAIQTTLPANHSLLLDAETGEKLL
jgi:hypothetical protein